MIKMELYNYIYNKAFVYLTSHECPFQPLEGCSSLQQNKVSIVPVYFGVSYFNHAIRINLMDGKRYRSSPLKFSRDEPELRVV